MNDLTEAQENLYRKIRGLLRKAEATNYTAEADAFLKKAQELMYTHAVDEEILWESEPDSRPRPVIETFVIKHNATGAMFQRVLLNSCAKYNRCKMWYNGSNCSICGFESDVLYVQMLYTSIMTQMNLQMAIGLAHSEENAKTYKVNFMEGFSYRIYDRLRELNHDIHTQAHKAHGKALVLSRDHQIEAFMREQGISLGRGSKVRTNARYSSEAREAGDVAGKHADITGGRDKLASSRRELNG